ncbi:hypothetical protein ACYZX9_16220 [Sphingomonas citri]|jgi:hypothetical protein
MSDQNDVQHYREREAAQRLRAEHTSDPAARARILELADVYAAVAVTQQALVDIGRQEHQRSNVGVMLGPPA